MESAGPHSTVGIPEERKAHEKHETTRKGNMNGVAVTRYRRTRYWAVWLDHKLLAVVCYKKGALAIRDVLRSFLEC